MDEEIEKFKLKNIFEVVKIPPGVKPITTRWVHTYKEKDLKINHLSRVALCTDKNG